jgi:2-polyprenyl-3-methyl-5-hydroxy-6-metoxy-1,4-benzoquinol methylase
MDNIPKILKNSKIPRSLINSCNFGNKYISRHIRKNYKTILEIGCGSCMLMSLLSEQSKEIKFIGLDPDIDGFSIFLEIKNYLIKNLNLCVVKDCASKELDLKFDLIYCVDVLEHVDNIDNLISFAKNKLSKSGKIIIICPNSSFWYEPHFNIPIIINKSITFKIFKKKILKDELNNNAVGLWDSLNFINSRKLEVIANKHDLKIKFHSDLSEDLILRVAQDMNFKKRKFVPWLISYFLYKTSVVKVMRLKSLTKFLPYTYAEIALS